jgi:hypothetical protein
MKKDVNQCSCQKEQIQKQWEYVEASSKNCGREVIHVKKQNASTGSAVWSLPVLSCCKSYLACCMEETGKTYKASSLISPFSPVILLFLN